MVLAVPYSRISSAEQRSGIGLDRQAADPAAYCATRGWCLYDGPGYSDEGISAFGGKNIHSGELGRFLADAKAGRFGAEPIALLVEDLDRFSRAAPLAVLPVLIDDLLNAGMTVSVMAKDRDISAQSIKGNQMELHELLFWLSASHDFSEKLSRRISHVHRARREQIREGKPVTPANAPAWIDLDNQGCWVLNNYAGVIRRVLAMAADGHGCHSIATTLNSEGIPSPGQYRREQWAIQAKRRNKDTYKPVAWSSASVKQVISNPAIIGDRQVMAPGYRQQIRDWQEKCALLRRQGINEQDLPKHPTRTHEAPQKSYYPAIASEEEQAGLLLAMRRRQPRQLGQIAWVRWLAAGLTYCSCGERIGAACTARKNGYTRWLQCKGRAKGKGCNQAGVNLKEAQAALLTRLKAESLLAMFEEQQGGEKQTALAAAIARQSSAQSVVDQITAAIAAGEQAMAAEADPAVLGVLARRQVQQYLRLDEAAADLRASQGEVQQLQSAPGAKIVAAEAQQQSSELLQTFARQEDTPDERRAVQHHLGRMGLRVRIDGNKRQLGLQIGDGPVDWQPLAPAARQRALADGIVDPASGWDKPGIGATVITRNGEMLVDALPGEPPVDPEAAGYAQGLEDARRLLGIRAEAQEL